MSNYKWLLISASLLYSTLITAKDFGYNGYSFPIEEESLATVVQKKMTEAFLQDKWGALQQSLLEQASHPKPVKGLQEAQKTRSFLLDPSFTIKEDLHNHTGKVFAQKGTKINPLHHTSLATGLLFFDGDNEKHLTWAKEQVGRFKWILVKGNPIKLEEQEKIPIYFDQQGIYTRQFHIEHIPAKVSQQGSFLLIEEVALSDKGGPHE